MSTRLISAKTISAALVIAALGFVVSTRAYTEATVTTDKKMYSVGEGMTILGSGFSPNVLISVSVFTPDHTTETVAGVISNSIGSFSAAYTPANPRPGRFRITAADGANTATTATTEADAIGYNKGVYNKGSIAPNDTTGSWTTGNAGGNYNENQWAYYQYEVTGIGTTVPSFDVVFNHFQSSSGAVFVDAFANFRACVDCTDSTDAGGLLADGVPYPPNATTFWKPAITAVSLINHPFTTTCQAGEDAVNSPSGDHCFHVDGAALAALFPAGTFTTGTHTVTLFYAAHLAASFVWTQGNEYLVGCVGSINYVNPYPPTMPDTTAYGTDAYSGGTACANDSATDWTAPFLGVGSATGSSRHFELDNQTSGSQGGITLPIPTVPAPNNHLTITKVTNPASAAGAVFPFSGSVGSFNLDTDPSATNPSTRTFDNIAAGVTYSVTEGATSGWTLTNLVCTVTTVGSGGTADTLSTSTATGTASITLDATAGGRTITCTYTNTGNGHIIVDKVTNPSADPTSFAFVTTGTGYNGFSLTDAAVPNNQTLAPGSYSVSETVPSGWALSTRVCVETVAGAGGSVFPATLTTQPANITLAAGATITCTFTNNKNASITLVKNYTPATDSGTNFSVAATQPGTNITSPVVLTTTGTGTRSSGALTITTFGNYSFLETVPSGWNATGTADCVLSGGGTTTGTSATQTATINVTAGQSWTCTVTNAKNASITLVKNYTPATDSGTNFSIAATQPGTNITSPVVLTTNATGTRSSGALTITTFGNYSFLETVPSGWNATGTADCALSGGGTTTGTSATQTATINVTAGQSWTCTVTNAKGASITLVKNYTPTTDTGTNFSIAATQPGSNITSPVVLTTNATGTRSSGALAITTFGNYSFLETVPSGWAANGTANCVLSGGGTSTGSSATQTATINVTAGQSWTCTFTNTKQAQLHIIKSTLPDGDTTDFSFTPANWGSGAFTRRDNQAAFDSGFLTPGATNYDTVESVPSGWALTGRACLFTGTANGKTFTSISNGIRVNLAAGDNVTCTFTDTKQALARVLKTLSGAAITGTETFTFTLRDSANATASGNVLQTVVANSINGGTLNFTPFLVPGNTYQVCESVLPGWNSTISGLSGAFVIQTEPDGTNDTICVSFTPNPGDLVIFTINNTPPPNGLARTIGFWKNWSSCSNSNGKQAPVLDQTLALFPLTNGSTHGFYLGTLYVDTCAEAVSLLNKSTLNGKKSASDPIFNMTAQLVAALLNLQAGAATCTNLNQTITQALALLSAHSFNGNTYSPKLTGAEATYANQLATILDNYNNTSSCPGAPPPPAP